MAAVNDTQQISGAAELAQALMDELAKRGLNNLPNIDRNQKLNDKLRGFFKNGGR